MGADHLTWWGVFTACLGAATPIIAVLVGLHMQNRSDKRKSDSQLMFMLNEYPLHGHDDDRNENVEASTPLTVGGLRRPKGSINGRFAR